MKQNETKTRRKNDCIIVCKLCDFKCSKRSDWNRHILTRKHKMKQNETKNAGKCALFISCELCDDICSSLIEWDKHVLTRKHKMKQNETKNAGKSVNKDVTHYTCELCDSIYTNRTSLWRHRKCCSINEGANMSSSVCTTYNYQEELEENDDNVIQSSNNVNIKELIMLLMKENQDVQIQMQKNFLEIIPQLQGVNNSHNTTTTNTHNTQNFNIQMFLNEHCKNAMNLTDFIDTLPITAETYDNTIENGLTKTITNMVVNGLNQLDVLERPIHCTDASRKTLYVKEDNAWEKDTELLRILMGIKKLAYKQRTLINTWKDMNDGWEKDDNIQTKLTTLICHSMTDIENDEKETGKIIRAIGKNTYLSNDIKDVYKI